ncbi:hypothetical protein EIKCOROL_01183 [Eikenella corrodens ATCC 23834]|uniref:Uncharacterized protein n=1 Tax=Eikenella corrodens ATCC 23834 TaxID=546274 RepID=C0DUZ4_EIKCO|nr:hypothetical protein EIKCOROL_01183 [Eikenella corrodens ATCC 23834]
MGVFGVFGFEEFAPGGGVEEEVGHFHAGAYGMGGRGGRLDLPVAGAHLAGGSAAFLAAGEGEAGHGGDAGQPFAAKTHAAHVFQILQRGDFAGGVAGEGEREVVGVDAAAVIGHADEADAAAGQLNLDAGGAGINTVFDDFFERGSGAFHHFAGGDLVHEVVGQGMDTGHDGSRGWAT